MRLPVVGLTRSNWLREFSAEITLLAISVPLDIGYAQIAGLPATAGIYALIVPTVVFALPVCSRQVVASPDAAAAAMVASSLMGMDAAGSENYAQVAAAQAILGGVMFLLCAVFKLGFLADFLSKPILVGFVGGLALDITVSQAAKVLGVPINSGGEFGEKLFDLVSHLGEANPWAMCLRISSILILLWGATDRCFCSVVLDDHDRGHRRVCPFDLQGKGVSVLGEVPAGLPTFSVPVFSWSTWLALIPLGHRTDRCRRCRRATCLSAVRREEQLLHRSEPRPRVRGGEHRTQLPSLVLAVGSLVPRQQLSSVSGWSAPRRPSVPGDGHVAGWRFVSTVGQVSSGVTSTRSPT